MRAWIRADWVAGRGRGGAGRGGAGGAGTRTRCQASPTPTWRPSSASAASPDGPRRRPGEAVSGAPARPQIAAAARGRRGLGDAAERRRRPRGGVHRGRGGALRQTPRALRRGSCAGRGRRGSGRLRASAAALPGDASWPGPMRTRKGLLDLARPRRGPRRPPPPMGRMRLLPRAGGRHIARAFGGQDLHRKSQKCHDALRSSACVYRTDTPSILLE